MPLIIAAQNLHFEVVPFFGRLGCQPSPRLDEWYVNRKGDR